MGPLRDLNAQLGSAWKPPEGNKKRTGWGAYADSREQRGGKGAPSIVTPDPGLTQALGSCYLCDLERCSYWTRAGRGRRPPPKFGAAGSG